MSQSRSLEPTQRRVLGVLIEKAKTTPGGYPMTAHAVVTGCNQKNNRDPVTAYDAFEVEKTLSDLQAMGLVKEVDWVGRVAKYKHNAYEWLGVRPVELAILAELLLRGAQSLGDLRARASRMEPIPDLAALKPIVEDLVARGLMVALTAPGRGQIVTHALYPAAELAALREKHGAPPDRRERAPARAAHATRSGRVEIRGVSYHYELRGRGEPLLLLHGGLGTLEMFGPNLETLADRREVIGVDLQGHGRSTLGDRPIRLTDMGDDLARLLETIGHDRVDVLGYSMGGGVALRLAVQHSQRVRRLVVVSAGFAQHGFHPEMLPLQSQVGAGMAEAMRDTPMYRSYAAVAPDLGDFPRLLDRMGELMRQPYDWADDVRSLPMPVMLVYGDADMIRLDHAVEFYRLLGGGARDAGWQREHMSKHRLAILPDLTHYEIFAAPALATTVLPFLEGRSGAASWADQVEERERDRADTREARKESVAGR